MRKAFYINLDRATERRANLERSFASYTNGNCQLSRFTAIDASECAHVAGAIRPTEKGCFLSHAGVIASQADGADFLVLEDDAEFGAGTFNALDRLLETAKREAGDEWDILFTDALVTNAGIMTELVLLRNELKLQGSVINIDLAKNYWLKFIGAAAYLVNGRSVAKLAANLMCRTFARSSQSWGNPSDTKK